MKKLRTFRVQFIGWTATKPSRVKITDLLNSKTVYCSIDKRYIWDDAHAYLLGLGIRCNHMSEDKNSVFLLHTEDFTTDLK